MAKVIEQCQVAPSTGSAAELTLPLTYFDHIWLTLNRVRRVLFYKLPISKSEFAQNIIPLKDSLSLTLKHYMPLAGNIVCPLDSSGYPELRYVTGDSVSVTISESDADFNFLIGNHQKDVKDLYSFVPLLGEPKDAPGVQLGPVFAIQVTLFPNHGVSIGFTNHHVLGDGATIVGFIKAWALLNKFNRDEQHLANEFVPCYDRSIIKDPYELGKLMWVQLRNNFTIEMRDVMNPSNKVQATFIIRRDDIEKLKNLILLKKSNPIHVTSFTVTCAYVWTCLIKSQDAIGDQIDENGMEFFGCAANCRARLDPPLPSSYFGNCIVAYITKTRHVDLAGNEGFTTAVELIGETIQKRAKDEKFVLTGEWFKELMAVDTNRLLSIVGSPKLDLYQADFGWGKPEKYEFVGHDVEKNVSMSLGKCKDLDGALEVGLWLPKTRMDAFATIFTQGLHF
ncbi:hypothetical protein FXO37_03909 [Capsicum annuum]|uniref:phenolic glucoside malonyltransferase 1 n=1 Tax=Capsicum annuum TaxID=4072 RepID=UPI001FB0F354|nr:phenolic glucoside malonyltransferase 1 [Capsicum annuum]KAF3679340.1 hypothetical protein FXO37_03909 [Capsicum annuum]